MVIRLVVVILLILWASDKEKALAPALTYAAISLGFGLLVNGLKAVVFTQVAVEFVLAFGLFWLVGRTGGIVGWLVRGVTVLVLGGIGAFLAQVLGK